MITAPLSELVDLTLSSVDKKSKPGEKEVLLCNYMDVYNNNFIDGNLNFMTATASEREIARCSLAAGDVVITKDSEQHDDIGVPALVIEDIPALVCGYHLAILRPKPSKVSGSYLYYALQIQDVQHQFHSFANGITRFGLRKSDIELAEIPSRPLAEQETIAHVLGTLDEKIELNRRMNRTLEEMARAVFKDWFVDFGPTRAKLEGRDPYLPAELWDLFPNELVDSELGEIPQGWEVKVLEQLIQLNPREPLNKGSVAPYLDMAALPTTGSIPETPVPRAFTSGARFRNGDTLLARITPCLENGKTAFVQSLPEGIAGWGSTEFIVMRPIPPVPQQLTYFLARDCTFRAHAIQSMTGTSGRQRVQAEALSSYSLPCPPPDNWAIFSSVVEELFARVKSNTEEIATLTSQRNTLLPKLVSGEVRMGELQTT